MTPPPVANPIKLLRLQLAAENGLPDQDTKPIILNEGTRWQEPLTVALAIAWGERLADEWLPRR